MAVLVAMLYVRYQVGKYPLALVSMDNCSQNGAKLRESVLTMAEEWKKAGYVDEGFVSYVSDEDTVAFPWTMIDKIIHSVLLAFSSTCTLILASCSVELIPYSKRNFAC